MTRGKGRDGTARTDTPRHCPFSLPASEPWFTASSARGYFGQCVGVSAVERAAAACPPGGRRA